MNADHELLKDFVARSPRAAPERPSFAMPQSGSTSGTPAAFPPRRAMGTAAPDMPELKKPESPQRAELAMPQRTESPSPPKMDMPTFASKERAAQQTQVVEAKPRDMHMDVLKEIRDLLRSQSGDKTRTRFEGKQLPPRSMAPNEFAPMLRRAK